MINRKKNNSFEVLIIDRNKIVKGGDDCTDFELHEEPFDEFPDCKLADGRCFKPLLYASCRELSPEIFFLDLIEVNPQLRGNGLGAIFYTQLENISRTLGYRFIGALHYERSVKFFLKRGVYILEELKTRYSKKFDILKNEERDNLDLYFTIKFLFPEDIGKYIRKERVNATAEEKIEYKQALMPPEDFDMED